MARYLALDWDAGHVHLLVADVGKSGVSLVRALDWAEEQSPGPGNADAFGTRLKDKLKDAKITPAPLLIAVGRDKLVFKEVRFPNVPAHEEPGIVRFQAMKELSDGEDVTIDYQPADGVEPSGEKKALAVALKRVQYQAYQAVAKAAGLKLAGVTPRSFGAIACLRRNASPAPEAGATVAVLTVATSGGEFAVARGENLAFTRSVAATALASDSAMFAEVRRNLAVYSGQAPQSPVRALYVAEAAGDLGVADRLRDTLAIPVHRFDPLAGLTGLPPEIRPGAYAGAAGLFQFEMRGRDLPVNFVSPREPKPPRDPNRRMLAWSAGLAAAVLLSLAIFGWTRIAAKDREFAKLSEIKAEYDRDLVSLDQDDRRYKAVKEWQDSEVVMLDELYDVTAAVPDISKMRVTHMIVNPIATAATQGKTNKYAARVELKGLIGDDQRPLQTTMKELDLDGYHRVEAKNVSPNTTSNRRQFGSQWSTRFDVEKRVDEKEKRTTQRYDKTFTATPPARRSRNDGMVNPLDIFGGLP